MPGQPEQPADREHANPGQALTEGQRRIGEAIVEARLLVDEQRRAAGDPNFAWRVALTQRLYEIDARLIECGLGWEDVDDPASAFEGLRVSV